MDMGAHWRLDFEDRQALDYRSHLMVAENELAAAETTASDAGLARQAGTLRALRGVVVMLLREARREELER